MIVKNEETVIERCLKSAEGIFDELIIVDTGSSDNTKTIASRFTNKVFDFIWVDDFSLARNYSFSKATMDYIMWLDADDIILPHNRQKLIELKTALVTANRYDMVALKYDVTKSLQSTRERIFKRSVGHVWLDPIHEYIPLSGNVLYSSIVITHAPKCRDKAHSKRNINIYKDLIKKGAILTPRQQYYYARELKDHRRFSEASKWFNRFLRDGKGWVEDNIAACFNLSICYRQLGKPDQNLKVLNRSFFYDAPRAEICCQIAYHYKNIGDIKAAISWFETALNLPAKNNAGFILKEYAVYIPALELAVCYDKFGEYKKANAYNEVAGKANPKSNEYLQNKAYFEYKLRTI